jgi:uroporphyrinogen-III decarboxylase
VIETIAPPPEGDNDLAESRRHIDPSICTKGNFSLGLLRDGKPDQISAEAARMVAAVRGTRHIHSTADGVLEGTPPENFFTFIQSVRESSEKLAQPIS